MEDLIAETPADEIEGIGIKLALYIYVHLYERRRSRNGRQRG